MTSKKLSRPGEPASPRPADAPSTFAATGSLDDTTEYAPLTAAPEGAAEEPARDGRRPVPARKVSRLGDFRLLAELGRGAMGVVYKARQVSRPRLAAVKVLSRRLAAQPDFLQRFYREARLLARLDHPNLLCCYEVGEDQGWHYLAIELLEGGSLDSWLRRLGRFTVGDALHIVLACARGLGHAHDLNLVHRDIKPENVLLAPDGTVKVADLGLAKATDDELSLTRTGMGAGTPLYMAPEQAMDAKRVDGRSDIYALGGTFYHLLTGRPPFEGGGNFLTLFRAKQTGIFPPAGRFNPEVPPRLEAVLVRMLAPQPEQRYQDCAQLIADLDGPGLAHPRLSFLPPQ